MKRDTVTSRSGSRVKGVTARLISTVRMNDAANDPGDIAVVGMACRFPGANSPEEYWANLVAGTNSVSEIPADRWDWSAYYGDPQAGGNKSLSKWGGFVADAARFDAGFFGISPRETERMDPQQRCMLELAWQCIEDAGYRPADLSGRDIGVYVGASTYDYKELQEKHSAEVDGHMSTGVYNCVIPNRVSYFFNFHGPSLIVDTACSSSLVAIHHAVNAIKMGECEAALAGGVSLLATPTSFISFGKVGMLSPSGACRTFDERADGYVRGEGGGLVLLKPFAKAVADGDGILGVIRASAVNHGGRARSLTAPNALSQSKVISAALRRADVSPATIGYVECHGTGTPLGDPIEVLGLARAFQQVAKLNETTLPASYCGLGAVKTNIGHLEAAAGVASFIKVLLAFRHGTLPGNVHFANLNSRIKLDGTPFYVLREPRQWNRLTDENGSAVPLRAGVSSFGFGGANGHVILEEGPTIPERAVLDSTEDCATEDGDSVASNVLTISAFCDTSLRQLASRYVDVLRANPARFADVCREANTTRTPMSRRLSVTAESSEGAIAAISAYLGGDSTDATWKLSHLGREKPRIGFLYTGQGSQYLGMGKELHTTQPIFREALRRCDALLAPHLERSVIELMFSSDADTLRRTRYTQPVLFAIEYALTDLWKSFGVVPEVVIGHSVGEVVAACVAGVFTLEDAARLIARRGALMDAAPSDGAMAAVMLDRAELEAFLATHRLALDIAAENAPRSTVISGERVLIEAALERLAADGVDAKRLEVSQAFHSRLMDSVQSEFLDSVRDIALSKPAIKIISNVTGAVADDAILDPRYWVEHIRKPVLFRQGIERMRAEGVNVFIEIGPSPVLTRLAQRTVAADDARWLSSLTPKIAEHRNLVDTLGELFTLGVDVDFQALYRHLPRRRVALPAYPFAGERYWITPDAHAMPGAAIAELLATERHPLLGRRVNVAASDTVYYAATVRCDDLGYLGDHCVGGDAVLPGAAYLEMALSALRDLTGDGVMAVEDVVLHRPLMLGHDGMVQTVLKRTEDPNRYSFEIVSSSGAAESAPATWVLHASGVVAGNVEASAEQNFVPDHDSEHGQIVEPRELYTRMTGYGLTYGPGFQGVCALQAQQDHGVAEVLLPAAAIGADSYLCHPALLDSVLQSALPLLPADAFRNGLLPLPVAVTRMWIRGKLPDRVRVVTQLVEADTAQGSYRCDYRLYAMNGESLGEITGLTLKRVSLAKFSLATPSTAVPSGRLFYRPAWVRRSLPVATPAPDEQRTVLLVHAADGDALADAITRRSRARKIVRVRLDHGVPDAKQNVYTVAADDAAALAAIVAAHRDVEHIYFLGGFHLSAGSDRDIEHGIVLDAAQRRGVLCLFHLIKSLNQGADRDLGLTVVTHRSHAVFDGDPVIPWGAAAPGLASVFCNENTRVRAVNVDLDLDISSGGNAFDAAAACVVAEPALELGATVAYRGHHRYCRQLDAFQAPELNDTVYRKQGVYLVLGGAGGLGLALSRHLARNYQARLVWVGRSPLDEAKKLAIADIERLGGQAVYFQADGGDVEAMKQVVSAATQRFGRLNGAIHSALVLRDQSLRSMDAAAFQAGLYPKVQGAWALWRSVKDEPLDFLTFFSSVVSFLPNRGQANYVAGCAFKDSFAHFLRNNHAIPVHVINWGRWGGVGAVASDAYERRLDAQGIYAITPDEGIDAVARSLASPDSQWIVLKADDAVLDRLGVDLSVEVRRVTQRAGVTISQDSDGRASAFELPVTAETVAASYDELEWFAGAVLLRVFHDMLGETPTTALGTTTELKARLRVVASYERLYSACLDIMERSGAWRVGRDGVFADPAAQPRDWPTLQRLKDALSASCPWLNAEIRLLWECGTRLAEILRGEVLATQVMFPNLSMVLVESVYSTGPLANYYNGRVADAVLQAVTGALADAPAARKVRILEVGAGTGGTSRIVLDHLKESGLDIDARVDYLYTDISAAFLRHGKDQFGKNFPSLSFEILDIEKPIEPQGFEAGSFDVVFASNVLHATHDLSRTLQHVKFLLKRDGVLILHELARRRDFLTLTFGLLDGWWLFEDTGKRIPHSPVLTPAMWCDVLREEGFTGATELAAAEHARRAGYLGVIAAQSDGRIRFPLQTGAVAETSVPKPGASVRRITRVNSADVLALARTATPEALRTGVQRYLRAQLAEVLRLRDEQLDATSRPLPDMLLSELGIDSLTAMDLRNRLRKQLNVDVPVEKLLGGSSVQAVTELAHEQLMLNRLMGGGEPVVEGAAGSARNEETETFVL